jgi:glycosyltransferase involved in cell wall biosynthesis
MTIAEAMGYGRPVIATDYGGSSEYLSARTGYPVGWHRQHVGDGDGHPAYPPQAWWADADLDAAAQAMRQVVRQPGEARRRGRRAARRIRRRYAPAHAARQIARELSRAQRTHRAR